MSRAINLNLTRSEVEAAVLKHGAVVSAIEPLFPRGTRVVLKNGDHAAAYKAQLIEGPVKRTPLRTIAR